MYTCLIELLNNINDMKIRKGKKDDLPVILELIKELADYENALAEVKVTLEQLEDDIGEEIELDVIALCCEYAEYDSLAEFREDYGEDYNTMQDIEYHTTVIMIDDESFIIQQF